MLKIHFQEKEKGRGVPPNMGLTDRFQRRREGGEGREGVAMRGQTADDMLRPYAGE